jgi:hypothetical protein
MNPNEPRTTERNDSYRNSGSHRVDRPIAYRVRVSVGFVGHEGRQRLGVSRTSMCISNGSDAISPRVTRRRTSRWIRRRIESSGDAESVIRR